MKLRIIASTIAVILVAASTILAFAAAPTTMSEAKCAMTTFEVEYDNAHAVFVGIVLSSRKEGNKRYFTFGVKRFWKGVGEKEIELSVSEYPRFQAPFEEGKTFLVFAKRNEDDGSLFDGRCSRSSEIGGTSSTIKDDLKQLGEGKTCISLNDYEERSEKY